LLEPGTTTLLVAFDYPQHEMQGPPFSVQTAEVQTLYSRWCDVELLCTEDILEREPHFRDKGVSRMREQVYKLIKL
jgi:thiopurine S-methyltransferase